MPYVNLPGIFENVIDGNLTILNTNNNPVVLVLGTATQGETEALYQVTKVSDAARTFGKTGNLVRGLYETSVAGAANINLMRIGATSATLVAVGANAADGYTITTIRKDDSAGTDYSLFYEGSTKRLRVKRVSDGEVVYDNYPAYPLQAIDLGEVSVTGTADGATSIGSSGTYLTLAAADGTGDGPAVFTAGTDGVDVSLMQTYEALYNAYALLEDQNLDIIVPMNVYLDSPNIMDLAAIDVTSLGLAALSAYPNSGSTTDFLGKLHVEEFEGVNYFWWWFPADPATPVFAAANIFPSNIGSCGVGGSLSTDGTALTAADFHEVNFAQQLAAFCYKQSDLNKDMLGFIGVLPPTSFSLKDVSTWVGSLPVTTVDGNGNAVISTNGSGLLGNKFMSGRVTASGVPGLIVNAIDGLYNGGFIATDDYWMDGTELQDSNEHLIDIGKYLSVVDAWPILANPSRATSYVATGASTYAGFVSGLPAQSAPTNKVLNSVRLPFRLNTSKLDLLAGQRYVSFHTKTKGIVVSDAPTAARPDSDFRRLSTIRIVKATVDAVRAVAEPFLGEGITGALLAACEGSIDRRLGQLVKEGTLVRYEEKLTSTAQQRIQGQATLELKLVPAFELRQITVNVALAAV